MSRSSTGKLLKSAKARATDLLGADSMDALKSIKDDLKDAGTQVVRVAKEVSEDCDNEVLSNARAFYADAFTKTRKGLQASIRSAEKYAEEEPVKNTLREDLKDTGDQLRQVAKEVIEDCDNDTLRTARTFYSDVADMAGNEVRRKAETVRIRSEKRKQVRAAARRRRAALRKKLGSRAAMVVICLIVAAVLLLSGAFWISQHYGGRHEAPQASEATPQASAEPSLLGSMDGDSLDQVSSISFFSMFEKSGKSEI